MGEKTNIVKQESNSQPCPADVDTHHFTKLLKASFSDDATIRASITTHSNFDSYLSGIKYQFLDHIIN